MEYNVLGEDIKISEISFGGIPILSGGFDIMPPHFNLSYDDSHKLLNTAYDFGINFFDTAVSCEYGDSEKKIGEAFKSKRNNVIISSKARAYSYQNMKSAINSSLKELGSSYIDIYGIHQVSPFNFEQSFDCKSGAIKALIEAKRAGVIRAISVGTHFAETAAKCSSYSEIDMIQLPFNPLEEGLFSTALEQGLEKKKTIFHKIYGGGMLPYFCSTRDLLHYALKAKALAVFVGIGNMFQLQQLIKDYEMGPSKQPNIYLPHSECNRCQLCKCVNGLNISTLLRQRAYAFMGFHRWAYVNFKETYSKECIECGNCLDSCPRGLNIPGMIKQAKEWFDELEKYKEVTNEKR